MTAPVMEMSRLCKSFGPVEVLKNISVSIEKGEFLVLLGPSGCGKSTLLNCIAGLEEISGGELKINGKTMNQVPPKDRDIAMVFQSYALYPNMTVAENISFGMKVRAIKPQARAAKTAQVAKLLQIEPLLDRKPSQLSGGQRQRVAMGRALVRDPMLFLFDEPLSNLDAQLRVEMRAEIRRLHQTLKSSIVYVTHDQIEALTLATRIVVLKDGDVQQIGTPSQVYNRPANLFVAGFMGAPAMNILPATLSANGNCIIAREDGGALILHPTNQNFSATGEIDRPVVFGLRPEDMTNPGVAASPDVQIVPWRIKAVEPTGSDLLVVFSLAGKDVMARMRADTNVTIGADLDIAFDLSKVSFFDPDTGKRLT
jgi:multiple sugar transport system ATP-binding protein